MVGAGCPNLYVELLGGPGDQNVYFGLWRCFWAPKALFGVLGSEPLAVFDLPGLWRGFGRHDHGSFWVS